MFALDICKYHRYTYHVHIYYFLSVSTFWDLLGNGTKLYGADISGRHLHICKRGHRDLKKAIAHVHLTLRSLKSGITCSVRILCSQDKYLLTAAILDLCRLREFPTVVEVAPWCVLSDTPKEIRHCKIISILLTNARSRKCTRDNFHGISHSLIRINLP